MPSIVEGAKGYILFKKPSNIFGIPVDPVIKALISPFSDLVITGVGPSGPHLLSTVVLLILNRIYSFQKHAPSHFTSINVILWELTGVLIGLRNCIQATCL